MTTQEPRIILNKSKTKRQDDIHLWLTKADNLRGIFKQLEDTIIAEVYLKYNSEAYITPKYGGGHAVKTTLKNYEQFTVAEPSRAIPVGNGSIDFRLQFGLPIILSLDELIPETRYVPEKHNIKEQKKLVTIFIAGLIKPDLESIDRAMKQINKYAYSKNTRQGDFIYLEAIITYDENNKYDSVLEQEDIQIIRIPEPK